MNWDALQAIAELTAAVAVLFSLGYLALQVRQNTASVQSATVARSSEILNRTRNHLWKDAESARIYQLALSGDVGTAPTDAVRVRLFLAALARDYEAIYFQHVSGQLPNGIWEGWLKEMLIVFCSPGGRDALEALSGTFLSEEFADFLKREVNNVDGSARDRLLENWSTAATRRRDGET